MFDAFRGPSGQISMRRVIAFLYAVAGIAAGFVCMINNVGDWKEIAAAFGVPSGVSVILLLFTTWADLTKTIDSVKGNRQVSVTKEEKDAEEKSQAGE